MFDVRRWFAAKVMKRPPLDDFDRAAALTDEGNPSEALAALERLLDGQAVPAERRAFAHNKRGVAFMALGRRDDSLDAFCAALVALENYAPALVNVGNMLLEDGDLDDAVEYYRAAIRSDATYPGAHLNLGVALKRAGRSGEAARHLRKAIRLEARRRF
jgi:tetratricopeptide (TPR) repeat protein